MSVVDQLGAPEGVQVEGDVYNRRGESYPAISWQGMYSEGAASGFWLGEQDLFPSAPEGWKAAQHKFGRDPSNPLVDVYVTKYLRAVVLGFRRCWVVKRFNGRRERFPWYTSFDDMGDGDKSSRVQVMVRIKGFNDPYILGLGGKYRSMSWSNRNKRDGFPVGAMEKMVDWVADVDQTYRKEKGYSGAPLPWMCMWWWTFGPARGDSGALWVNAGQETYVNPFTAYTETEGPMQEHGPAYVGPELFSELQAFRANEVVAWEDEWEDRDEGQDPAEAVADDDGPPPNSQRGLGHDADDIPF